MRRGLLPCSSSHSRRLLAYSRIDGARNATALIKTRVKSIRAHWPDTRILVRGDSGFCRQRLLRWCEKRGVFYVIGLARNERLQREVELVECAMKAAYEQSGDRKSTRLNSSHG